MILMQVELRIFQVIESETSSGWTKLENMSSTLENLVVKAQQAAISETRGKLKGEWKELQDIISTRYRITFHNIS